MAQRVAFELLFQTHAGAIRAYATRRVGVDEADDVVAEVFIVAWRRFQELPPEPLPWLLAVARRVLANRQRGQVRRSALNERLRAEPAVSGAEPLVLPAGDVAAALAALTEDDREVLLLSAWEGLSNVDAARVLGVRPGTFTVRLHRARRRFAHALAAAATATPPPRPDSTVHLEATR